MALNIFHAQNYRRYLRDVLRERSSRNPAYSLRAFARDINLSAGRLSRLLNGQSSLSLEKAKIIAERLALKTFEQDYFIRLVEVEKSGRECAIVALRQEHAFAEMTDGSAIAHDIGMQDFALYLTVSLLGRVDAEKAKRSFGMDADEFVTRCIRLQTLGWLEGSEKKGWSALNGFLRSESFDRQESNRIYHDKVLALAQQQLHHGDISERSFYALVFSLSRSDYEDLWGQIVAFCGSKTDAFRTRDSHDRIYTLGLQLLPIAEVNRDVTASPQS